MAWLHDVVDDVRRRQNQSFFQVNDPHIELADGAYAEFR